VYAHTGESVRLGQTGSVTVVSSGRPRDRAAWRGEQSSVAARRGAFEWGVERRERPGGGRPGARRGRWEGSARRQPV